MSEKKKPGLEIEHVKENLFRAKRGNISMVFVVAADYKMTVVESLDDRTPKDFHFEGSNPSMVINIAAMLKAIGWHVLNMRQEAEKAKTQEQ
jgi:hypothetical protein